MVCILHLMATLVSWIFMIVVSISCVFGTGLLWYTYYEIRHGLREIPSNMILIVIIFFSLYILLLKSSRKVLCYDLFQESLRNEKAFLWYSIIATVITVSNESIDVI